MAKLRTIAEAKMKKNEHVSDLDFAITFQKCNSYKEASEKLKLAYGSVLARAKVLRKDGVALKEMPRGRTKKVRDIKSINAALAEINA